MQRLKGHAGIAFPNRSQAVRMEGMSIARTAPPCPAKGADRTDSRRRIRPDFSGRGVQSRSPETRIGDRFQGTRTRSSRPAAMSGMM